MFYGRTIVVKNEEGKVVMTDKSVRTRGGLVKKDLVKNKKNKIVSAKMSVKGKKNLWILACMAAREALNLGSRFVAIKKGSDYYKNAK